jgi:molecular chaperone DnaK (HSP70)
MLMAAEPPVFGIDLGTTNSCIARVSAGSGRPEVIPNSDTDLVTPSVVYFESESNIVVGKIAKRHAVAFPDRVCSLVKREMSKEPQNVKKLNYLNVAYSPEKISALILTKVVADALEAEDIPRGSSVRAVITVPAYFGAIGKNATLQAGKLANIEVLYVAPEPVAAALSYAAGQAGKDETVLVYDLGGGTFDVTVVETNGSSAKVIAVDGERILGGYDWDCDIADWFRQKVSREKGIELPAGDLTLKQQLIQKAEEVKIDLTRLKKAWLPVEYQGKSYAYELTVDEFEKITEPRLETTMTKTQAALEEARKKGVTKIDRLLLVGGSSRMRAVARRLKEVTGLEPVLHDPDQAVAKGAALLADMIQKGAFEVDLTGEAKAQSDESRLVTMLTPKGLGIEVYDPSLKRDVVRYLVPKNKELPASGSAVYGTYEASQKNIKVRVYEERGEESDIPDENTLLHESPIDLPPGLPAASPLEVRFGVDAAGVLHVFLKEPKSGSSWEIAVDKFSKTSDEDVERLKPARSAVV